MSSDHEPTDAETRSVETDDFEQQYAEAFDRERDPLAKHNRTFQTLPDPFDYFIKKVVSNRDTIASQDTIDRYHLTYRQWRNHMNAIAPNRHPACPGVKHIQRFIECRREVHGNCRRTILGKLSRLSQAYEYWQEKHIFPHPDDWNPFPIARKETSLGDNPDKDFHDLSLTDLRTAFGQLTNIRRRGIIGTQLKEGLRAGELCNVCIPELHISHQDLQEKYPRLGTHPAIGDHSDVMYIPHDRDGNKSSNPRLLPIDDELRWLLLRHLLTRPQVDEPYVFLSKRTFTKLEPQGVNREWKAAFRPQYDETDDYAAMTSHFGRHWFSSYWRLIEGMEREHVQYLRGDRVQPVDDFPEAIDEYLHPNYVLIEDSFRQNIFKLDIPLEHAHLD